MEVRVVRSPKRRKTISASMEEGVLVVRIPARMSRAQEHVWVERMRVRFEKQKLNKPESVLQRRAELLNQRYFGGKLEFAIEWVANQSKRWGSCTPTSGKIRLNQELKRLPPFVVDYVIVHELAHLLEANHGERFWKLVRRYPATDRAIGFLEGYHWARHHKPLAAEFGEFLEVDEVAVAVDG